MQRTPAFLQAILPLGLRIELDGTDTGTGMEKDSVLCEEAELSKIMPNLVRNAGHAMGGSGIVRIALTREIDEGAACLCLSVADTGTGMTPEVVARAFHPFYTTRTSAGGSGLGLSIAMAIALSWNARLGIETELGRGTLRLPIRPAIEGDASGRA